MITHLFIPEPVSPRFSNFFGEESVFIDMHQDLFSRKFCGDGAPKWAAVETTMEYKCGSEWFA